MKIISPSAGRTRYVIPFPRFAMLLGAVLLVMGALFPVIASLADVRGPPLLAISVAGLADVLFGLVLLGGTRFIEVERLTRQIATGYAVFGRSLPLGRQAAQASGQARLRVTSRQVKTTLFEVALVDAGPPLRLVSFTNAANARSFAAQVSPMLKIDIEDTLPAATSPR